MAARGSVLPPGQAALAPATQLASLAVGVNVALKTFKNVVGLDSQAPSTLGGLWQLLMGTAMVPVDAVWPTILTYSLAGGALVGALGSMFSIRKHLNV